MDSVQAPLPSLHNTLSKPVSSSDTGVDTTCPGVQQARGLREERSQGLGETSLRGALTAVREALMGCRSQSRAQEAPRRTERLA